MPKNRREKRGISVNTHVRISRDASSPLPPIAIVAIGTLSLKNNKISLHQ